MVRIPPLPLAEAGTWFSDPKGMQGSVDLCYVKADRRELNPRPVNHKSNALLLGHHATRKCPYSKRHTMVHIISSCTQTKLGVVCSCFTQLPMLLFNGLTTWLAIQQMDSNSNIYLLFQADKVRLTFVFLLCSLLSLLATYWSEVFKISCEKKIQRYTVIEKNTFSYPGTKK